MSRKLSRCEQETIISRTADEEGWNVYTCDPVMKRRLGRLAIAVGVSPTIIDRDGVEFTLPLNCVKFQVTRVLSDQERERRRQLGRRLAALRLSRTSLPDPVPAVAAGEGSPAC